MAATLSLDTLTSSGSGITVATGKTLTVGGVSVTAGSTNVQRATSDVTIGTTTDYEVAGKSEVVVAANAASSNRTITLPAVGATGMDTCIITIVADARCYFYLCAKGSRRCYSRSLDRVSKGRLCSTNC